MQYDKSRNCPTAILCLSALIMTGLLGCNRPNSGSGDSKYKESFTQANIDSFPQAKRMAEKWNAVIDWQGSLKEKTSRTEMYTVELDDYINGLNGCPALLFLQLDDIIRIDTTYILHLSSIWDKSPYDHIYYDLSCTHDQRRTLMNAPVVGLFDGFIMVASLSGIDKPRFLMKAYGDPEAEIQIDMAEIFLAKGKLLDFMYTPDIAGLVAIRDSIYGK